MFILKIVDKIGIAIAWITLWIVSGVYNVAAFGFKVFLILAEGRLVGTEDYMAVVNNIYTIIGVVMLFIIAFMLLKIMVDPDEKKGTAAVKKTIINLITSIVGVTLLAPIFDFAYDVQFSIVRNNTIGKILGFNSGSSTASGVTEGAFQVVNGVYTAFFYPDCNASNINELQTCYENQAIGDRNYQDYVDDAELWGNFSRYTEADKAVYEGEINYNFLMSLIGGLLLVYISVSYCFDMGLRLVKLAFYQVIAPIPILLRIVPDGKLSGMFSNWLKITATCFFEVFVRIIALYFCLFLCQVVMKSDDLSNVLVQHNVLTYLFVKAFIFMGLITFMRQAPKLIAQVTGLDSGNMSLGIRDKLAAGGAFAAGAIIGGGITSGVRNASNSFQKNFEKGADGKWHKKAGVTGGKVAKSVFTGAGSTIAGLVSGGVRSGKAGLNAKSAADMRSSTVKGAQSATDARNKRAKYKADHGGTLGGVIKGRFNDTLESAGRYFGFEEDYSQLQAEQSSSDTFLQSKKRIDAIAEDYITKHKNEFSIGLTSEQEEMVKKLKLKKQYAKHQKDKDAFQKQIDDIIAPTRLDVMEAKIKAAEKSGDAVAIAEATNAYNLAFKKFKDGFATTIFTHVDSKGEPATKEMLAVQAELDIINNKLSEEINSNVVQMLRNGYSQDGKVIVNGQKGDVTSTNAADFLKELKNAAEVTSSQIAAERQRLEMRQKKSDGK